MIKTALEAVGVIAEDRWLAHQMLFPHRHPDKSPPAHEDLVRAINSPSPRVSVEGFRGLAKTTYTEETAVLKAALREFHNLVVIGPSFPRACDRIAAIKNEFVINELLIAAFGPLQGPVWQDGKIVLANGVCLQALGRDQQITGIKHLEWRPDAFIIDDIEDPEENRSDLEREGTWRWLMRTFIPSLDHPLRTWGRFLGTRRGRGSLPERLEKAGVETIKIPIEHLDEAGERRATWPAKFPLPVIDEMRRNYRGDMDTYMQEYMCEATSVTERVFGQVEVNPRLRTFEPCWAMYDPARTTGRASAMTGKVVWSWIKNRLVFWESDGKRWLPDEIIADIFDVEDRFGPIWIGVEEDGLNEWIKQPLRQEALKRGRFPAMKPVFAPRDKNRFIEQLQPYWKAGEIEFARPMPEFQAQLLSFPYGLKDIPNAAAYALLLRPGAPIYESFRTEHVADSVMVDRARPLWLATNATRGMTVAAALQYGMGRTRILADWAIESEPAEAVPLIVREAGMLLRLAPTMCCGPVHYDRYQNVGLVQAGQRVPLAVERGSEPARGREVVRGELGRLVRDLPAVQVAQSARHTVNALAGGYCRMLAKGSGALQDEAEPGLYRLLMEAIESCLGRMAMAESVDENANWHYTDDGRRYMKYGHATQRRAQ